MFPRRVPPFRFSDLEQDEGQRLDRHAPEHAVCDVAVVLVVLERRREELLGRCKTSFPLTPVHLSF